jgi:thymidylate synthase (FAD)
VEVASVIGYTTKESLASFAVKDMCEASYELYKSMIEAGIAREMARMVLPVNIYTECYSCWDLKNLLHFVALREDSHAQAEIQEYAKAMKEILIHLFPWTMSVFDKYKHKLVEV